MSLVGRGSHYVRRRLKQEQAAMPGGGRWLPFSVPELKSILWLFDRVGITFSTMGDEIEAELARRGAP